MPLKFTTQFKNLKVAIPSLDDDAVNATVDDLIKAARK